MTFHVMQIIHLSKINAQFWNLINVVSLYVPLFYEIIVKLNNFVLSNVIVSWWWEARKPIATISQFSRVHYIPSVLFLISINCKRSGADLGGGCWGCAPLPLPPSLHAFLEMTCGFLMKLVFCEEKKTHLNITSPVSYPFLSGEPPPKKNPGSYPHGAQENTIKLKLRLG